MPRGCDLRYRLPWPELCRRPAEVLLLALLLSACGAATIDTNEDPDITTQVKIALLGDAQLGARRLDVKTFQHVVTLGGTVRSDAEAAQAIAIARRVRGVRDVKSELKVGGG